MAFPTTVLSLAHAAAGNFLSAWFGGSVAHSAGDNMIIDDLIATQVKLGITPSPGDLQDWTLVGDGAGKSLWVPSTAVGTNLVTNGSCEVDQRVGPYTTTGNRNNDGSYTLDRWIVLSDGNNVVDVAQETSSANLPAGSRSALKMTVVTANKKFGVATLLESAIARQIIGGTASLQYKVRTQTANPISNSREAILSWTGTFDAPTKDVVSTTNWNAAGSNPTFATSYTLENTPTNRALTNAWQTVNVDNVAIDTAATNNVALFFWVDDTNCAVGDIIYLTDVSLVKGPKAQPIRYQGPALERLACYRWLFVYGSGEAGNATYLGNAKSGTTVYAEVSYLPTVMRATPSVGAGPASTAGPVYTVSQDAPGTVTINNLGLRTFRPVNLGTAWTVNAQVNLSAAFSAELGV
jgi:hypothetical protein